LTDLIPILINIDVEPDEREVSLGDHSPWVGFEKTFAYFKTVRTRLEAVTQAPVHFNWLVRLDPQIETIYGDPAWPVTQYRHLLSELQNSGDEIGIHPHTWKWLPEIARWKSVYDPKWVRHCFAMSFRTFKREFSRAPRICKFGDHYISGQTVSLMEEFGLDCDLTLEPGYRTVAERGRHEPGTSPVLDFRQALRFPYRPSRRNFLQAGGHWWSRRRLWVIPVSSGATSGEVIRPSDAPDHEVMTLNLEFYAPLFRYISDALLGKSTKPYLSIVVRSDVPTRDHERTQMETSLDNLANHPWAHRFRFVTGQEALPYFF